MAHHDKMLHLHKFDFNAVMEATTDEAKAAPWAMDVGHLEKAMLCPQCTRPMRLNVRSRHWRCRRKRSHEDSKEVQRSIWVNSWFSKMNLPQAIRLIFEWCMRIPQNQAAHMAKVSENTASDWYAACRVLCSKELLEGEFKV
ncbi:unnamed protein product [Phytophthora fragariaefolia]|uniref:Unnamed protein product n=1 Tax=Phytophthora fragariaefolia TaxID=1490495 RepID=A0A9W7CL02_9STRA|nr:unnamed protein product [Phytophthora fragariaefolia]